MADAGRTQRPRGSSPETAKQELFLRLIGQGVTNLAARRQVGVHRRAGTRWRYGRRAVDSAGRGHEFPSIMRPAPTISDCFLKPNERLTIADQLRTGSSLRAIPRGLGHRTSEVSRGVSRNRDPHSGSTGCSLPNCSPWEVDTDHCHRARDAFCTRPRGVRALYGRR